MAIPGLRIAGWSHLARTRGHGVDRRVYAPYVLAMRLAIQLTRLQPLRLPIAMALATALTALPRVVFAQQAGKSPAQTLWNARAAADYLDGRQAWWLKWPTAARDHETSCISCHTALPYALARPALREALAEQQVSDPERRLVENVVKRVQLWRDGDPFYPDQTRGLPRSSELRGTEAVLNA